MTPQQEAQKLIESIDATLSVHREAWMDAEVVKKPDWWRKIDGLLDQRIEAMDVRDGIVISF
jgi:hypothetical protein